MGTAPSPMDRACCAGERPQRWLCFSSTEWLKWADLEGEGSLQHDASNRAGAVSTGASKWWRHVGRVPRSLKELKLRSATTVDFHLLLAGG
jgi:hypothetical protein